MSDPPTSVIDALNLLEVEGFTASFGLRGTLLACGVCGATHTTTAFQVVRVYRFEGPSDPDEEAVVYGLVCPVCGSAGAFVSSYGPGADPEIADLLVMLDERFRSS